MWLVAQATGPLSRQLQGAAKLPLQAVNGQEPGPARVGDAPLHSAKSWRCIADGDSLMRAETRSPWAVSPEQAIPEPVGIVSNFNVILTELSHS